jgi:sporulation protein YlmC with PRC-barrel domain
MPILINHELEGKTVIDGAGNAVGEVKEVLIDTTSWLVTALRVKLRRETAEKLGERHGAFHAAEIDLPVDSVSATGQTVVLNLPVGEAFHRSGDGEAAPGPELDERRGA